MIHLSNVKHDGQESGGGDGDQSQETYAKSNKEYNALVYT